MAKTTNKPQSKSDAKKVTITRTDDGKGDAPLSVDFHKSTSKGKLADKERRKTARRSKLKKVLPYVKATQKSLAKKSAKSSKSSSEPALTDYQLAQQAIQKALLS